MSENPTINDLEKRKFNKNGFIMTDSSEEVIKIDEVDSATTYIGNATFSSLTSNPVWKIKKISVSGTVTTIEWADGDSSYDNIWDNRAALTYS